jgi:ABC-type amino acid transport substrate-binding protein
MKAISIYIVLFLFISSGAIASQDVFPQCHTYKDSKGKVTSAKPEGSPTLYKIISESGQRPSIEPVSEQNVEFVKNNQASQIFRVANENASFQTYKCWASPDNKKMVTGFDVQLMTEILAKDSGYQFIEFVEVPWADYYTKNKVGSQVNCSEFDALVGQQKSSELEEQIESLEKKYPHCVQDYEFQLSFFSMVNSGKADAALAGMVVNTQRVAWAPMVGPIYKAGKFLLGREDNPKLVSSLSSQPDMQTSGLCQRYQPFKGLSVLESSEGGNIRGRYFNLMARRCPELVKTHKFSSSLYDGVSNPDELSEDDKQKIAKNRQAILVEYEAIKKNLSADHFNFLDIRDAELVETFMKNGMGDNSLFGDGIDLVMVDTGSIKNLQDEGVMNSHGGPLKVATAEVSQDPDIGLVFGLGDGIALRSFDNKNRDFFTDRIKEMFRDGSIDYLVNKWFDDENGADPDCIDNQKRCLEKEADLQK